MRRTTPIVLLLAALSLPSVTAGAAGSFTFYGSGYGHGLGLSQWGAYGLAKQGWGFERILTHFYSRTRVRRADDPPGRLRIGLTQSRDKIRLRARSGRVELRVDNPARGTLVGTIPGGDTWTIRTSGSRYKVLDDDGKRVGGRLWGGTSRDLFATYPRAMVRVPEAGHTYNRGYMEFNLHECGGADCRVRLIILLDPQAYLFGLAEVPSSWPMKALMTQAVAGRTYAFYKADLGQHRTGCNCALYASAADQVYAGWDKEGGLDGERWVRAVRQTENQVVMYSGRLAQTFYSSSSGGHTENNENVWGGSPIPYLRGVCDPGDYTPANPSRVWEVSYSADRVTALLRPYTGNIGTVSSFTDVDRGVSGRIVTVRVRGSGGSDVITGTQLRAALALRDDRLWINEDRNVTGEIREKYDRLGCAPGLPTSERTAVPGGARQRFQVGAIFRNDDPSATVWLRGAVYRKYLDAGGPKGRLGLPVAATARLAAPSGCKTRTCSRTRFEGGHIYLKEGLGAHALRGRVLSFYLSKKGPTGSLGFPKTDVRRNDDGSTYAVFEGGTVTCTSGGSCSRS